MENASKALIMAGSVLLAMIIIGLLIFTFSSISETMQLDADSEDVKVMAEYNRKFEMFNRKGPYGSEIMSLANLIDDYNKRQSEILGYESISLEVKTKKIVGCEEIDDNYISYEKLTSDFKKLESNVEKLRIEKIHNITVEKWAGMKTLEIEQTLKKLGYSETQIQNEIYKKNGLDEKITNYQTKKSELTEFKNKLFQIPNVEYGELNGRIVKMVFKEVGVL